MPVVVADGASSGPTGLGEAPALVIKNVSKTFGAKTVLDSFELELGRGEVHFLLGQNGSGKSTLIKILSGYHEPDPGAEVLVGGQPLKFGSAASAHLLGCRFVHQDLGLVETSSVLDNLFVGSRFPTRLGTVRRKAARRRARAALARVGLDIDPGRPASSLGAAERTAVAVARALMSDPDAPAHVLVLDEPTATLPVDEVERLRTTLRAAAASGVAIIYVTHHLDEVSGFADRVTVLRDGRQIETWPVAKLDRRRLVHQLIGSELEAVQRLAAAQAGPMRARPVLSVRGLSAGPLADFDLDVWGGEVLGLCGLTGSGREVALGAIFGAVPRDGGDVTVNGRRLPAARTDRAIAAGIGYLPPDRRHSGAVMDLTARENLTLVDFGPFWNGLWINRRREAAEARRLFTDLDVRPSDGLKAPLHTFSGGNQQKILFGKWLRTSPALLLLDEPTQGVDVGAKAQLHRHVLNVARTGVAVVVSSTDIEELATLCTRVLVIRDGRVVDELRDADVTAGQLTASFHGGQPSAAAQQERGVTADA